MLRYRYSLVLMRLFIYSTNFQSDQAKHADLFTKCQVADAKPHGNPLLFVFGETRIDNFWMSV